MHRPPPSPSVARRMRVFTSSDPETFQGVRSSKPSSTRIRSVSIAVSAAIPAVESSVRNNSHGITRNDTDNNLWRLAAGGWRLASAFHAAKEQPLDVVPLQQQEQDQHGQ